MNHVDWLLNNLGVGHEVSSASEMKFCCPFCEEVGKSPDTKFHFYYNLINRVGYCQRCRWSGSLFSLVRELTGAESFSEVWSQFTRSHTTVNDFESIASQLMNMTSKRKDAYVTTIIRDMPDWFIPFTELTNSFVSQSVLKYALKRLNYNQLIEYGLGYNHIVAAMSEPRLIIPIESGYYQARSIYEGAKQKYLNPPWNIDSHLFNGVALETYNRIYITEGVFDAISIGDDAVATIGNKATEGQKRRLSSSNAHTFIICYDADTKLSQATVQLAQHLVAFDKDVIIREYLEGDPDAGGAYTERTFDDSYALDSIFNSSRKRGIHGIH